MAVVGVYFPFMAKWFGTNSRLRREFTNNTMDLLIYNVTPLSRSLNLK